MHRGTKRIGRELTRRWAASPLASRFSAASCGVTAQAIWTAVGTLRATTRFPIARMLAWRTLAAGPERWVQAELSFRAATRATDSGTTSGERRVTVLAEVTALPIAAFSEAARTTTHIARCFATRTILIARTCTANPAAYVRFTRRATYSLLARESYPGGTARITTAGVSGWTALAAADSLTVGDPVAGCSHSAPANRASQVRVIHGPALQVIRHHRYDPRMAGDDGAAQGSLIPRRHDDDYSAQGGLVQSLF